MLKIMRVTATVDISKTTTIVPMRSPSAVTYLFKNVIENKFQYVLIAEDGTELKAVKF
jgi:hypothetical protein